MYDYVRSLSSNPIIPFPNRFPFGVISFQDSVVHKWRLQLWRQFLQAPYREAGSDTAWNIPAIGREECPPGKLTYPTWGKGKLRKSSTQKCRLVGNMLVPRRVCCGDVADDEKHE